ncbi:hypothetical protein [Lysinibacillus fusiformis]|uniref:hypothetical protein n=1 Tax=Lysinibacillus fusiformis TaxID=28031 RepID=UPI0018E5FFED|nr:hypothetical protein [Lysinibacillus fusiformis]MBI6865923.1 hypothetical protein [Lysinibacillus fusiformis]
MQNRTSPLSTYVIKNLMLEALSYTESDIDPEGNYFKQYGYAGTQNDLFRLTEGLAIKKGLIPNNVPLSHEAWGCHGSNLFEGSNTNFKRIEIERLFETFGILLNQNIIAQGMYRNSPFLPFFHVTDHGLECIEQQEILPYDFDGYLSQIRNIQNIDSWVIYYMSEAVRCFNSGCYNAATIMIGLSAEKIVLDLIEAFKSYLKNNKTTLTTRSNFNYQGDLDISFISEVDNVSQISLKYTKFNEYFNGINNHDASVIGVLDKSARNTFFDYIRLIRNEVSHPNDIEKNETETLLLFVSFIKYITLQTQLTSILKVI